MPAAFIGCNGPGPCPRCGFLKTYCRINRELPRTRIVLANQRTRLSHTNAIHRQKSRRALRRSVFLRPTWRQLLPNVSRPCPALGVHSRQRFQQPQCLGVWRNTSCNPPLQRGTSRGSRRQPQSSPLREMDARVRGKAWRHSGKSWRPRRPKRTLTAAMRTPCLAYGRRGFDFLGRVRCWTSTIRVTWQLTLILQ